MTSQFIDSVPPNQDQEMDCLLEEIPSNQEHFAREKGEFFFFFIQNM